MFKGNAKWELKGKVKRESVKRELSTDCSIDLS
jgi:hypothetical protein